MTIMMWFCYDYDGYYDVSVLCCMMTIMMWVCYVSIITIMMRVLSMITIIMWDAFVDTLDDAISWLDHQSIQEARCNMRVVIVFLLNRLGDSTFGAFLLLKKADMISFEESNCL